MLSAYSPSDPIYFGYKIKMKALPDACLNGGAGYVMSRSSLRLFVEKILKTETKCAVNLMEDWNMGSCM